MEYKNITYCFCLFAFVLISSTLQRTNNEIFETTLSHDGVDFPAWSESSLVINPVEPPLFVASFNIQMFGSKKFSNKNITRIIQQIIRRYDLILIMELITKSDRYLRNLLFDVNKYGKPGVVYNMTLSERNQYTNEHYAFIYRTDKLKVLKTESYNDPLTYFRKPYVVLFRSPTLMDMGRFIAVGHHVKPAQAVKEIKGMDRLYDYVKMKYEVEDVLLMGDFNADCSYVKEEDWKRIKLWTRPEFVWAIGQGVDTTTNYKSCALDRFVYAGDNMRDNVILSSAQVYNFQKAFGLSINETRNVSDHWPIEVKIRGGMSPLAKTHLSSDVCFTMEDSRPNNVSKESAIAASKRVNFEIVTFPDGFILSKAANSANDLINSVRSLRNAIPELLTKEQLHGMLYKINYGGLTDESSYDDAEKSSFKVRVMLQKQKSTIIVCNKTTVN